MSGGVKNAGGRVSGGIKDAGGRASGGLKDAGGRISGGLKSTGGRVSDRLKAAGGGVSGGLKSAGGRMSGGLKDAGGRVSGGLKDTGGRVSTGLKDAGRRASGGLKDAGGRITGGLKDAGGRVSGGLKDAGGRVAGGLKDAGGRGATGAKAIGGRASDAWKEHVNVPVGKPWNRGVRDPWVRWLNRGYTTLEDRWDRGVERGRDNMETGIVNGSSKIPQAQTGDEFDHRQVPGGKTGQSEYGANVLKVDAPQGGEVGFDVGMDMEGKTVDITMYVLVEKGTVGLGLERDDGEMVPAPAFNCEVVQTVGTAELRKITLTVDVPSDGMGYGRTDAAHDYRAVLQLDPGARVHVMGGGVQRAN